MEVILDTILEQLVSGIHWDVTLVEDLFVQQVFDQSPLIRDDRNIQSGLTGDGLGAGVSAARGQCDDGAFRYRLLQRPLRGRGYFFVVVDQSVVDVDRYEFIQ
ncbi:hypothetical protein D1872_269680 [compost metagenome]